MPFFDDDDVTLAHFYNIAHNAGISLKTLVTFLTAGDEFHKSYDISAHEIAYIMSVYDITAEDTEIFTFLRKEFPKKVHLEEFLAKHGVGDEYRRRIMAKTFSG